MHEISLTHTSLISFILKISSNKEKNMKIKRILAFLAGMLIAISAVGVTNQPEQVSASVFQKTAVPKKFRGTWYGCWGNGKVQPFKITRTEINLAGCADGGARVYKYTKRAYNAKDLLIRTKGNRMWICAPTRSDINCVRH